MIESWPDRLLRLGATDIEMQEIASLSPTEDDYVRSCFILIRQDRRGVIADQKKEKSNYRKRMMGSPSFRIRNSVSARLWAALKGRTDGALFSRLGYSADDLVTHLQSQFAAGMTWANYGKWHVDHIKPCALFDLADAAQFAECWALANLAPLWAPENIKKGATYGQA